MKFYSFDEIRTAADCRDVARELLGAVIDGNGRCAAVWRGGDNKNAVQIDPQKWYDHVKKEGGGPVELAAHAFGGDIQQAQQWLGAKYGLVPKNSLQRAPDNSRYSRLMVEGYTETKRWEYTDAGRVVHFTIRMDHPSKPKEYVQGTPNGWGLGSVDPILYNLDAIRKADWCCVAEGEKCADALIALGIPATTCAGGSKNWAAEYADVLAGKSVAILPDNDTPGADHAKVVAASLKGKAKSIRMVMTSDEPKGDVVDWLEAGGTHAELMALIAGAAEVDFSTLGDVRVPKQERPEVIAAKQANSIPFRNYTPVEVKSVKRGKETTDEEKHPRHISDLVDDVHRRFLGFPCRVGESMFDHDRDTGEINFIYRPADLFSWIGMKSGTQPSWNRGESMVTKEELFSGLRQQARAFESISRVPDWPERSDVYYTNKHLPLPCPKHSRFDHLISFFNPSAPEFRTLIKALVVSPLWYVKGIPKPLWIIDSADGQGTGKSQVAEMTAYLYEGAPIRTGKQELKMGFQELIKRIVSSEGRQKRVVLVDNVTGKFVSPELSDLVTTQMVSGKAPYGRGEETRPNNLTYVITVNSASVDADIASRSFFIEVQRPAYDAAWKTKVLNYIDANRLEIISDIIDLLSSHVPYDGVIPSTRFPEFETSILQALCGSMTEYEAVIAKLQESRAESNTDEDTAKDIETAFRGYIRGLDLDPDVDTVFIHSKLAEEWLKSVVDEKEVHGNVIQHVRNLAKTGCLDIIDQKITRYPQNGENRRRGLMWNREGGREPVTVMRDHEGRIVKLRVA